MNDDLKDFAQQSSSRFFSFEKEKELEAIFMSARKEQDKFGPPGAMWVRYYFRDQAGEEKEFASKSKRLAKAMVEAGVKPGDLLRVTRFGSGYETNYLVKKLPNKGKQEEAVSETVDPDSVPDLPF